MSKEYIDYDGHYWRATPKLNFEVMQFIGTIKHGLRIMKVYNSFGILYVKNNDLYCEFERLWIQLPLDKKVYECYQKHQNETNES